MASRTAEHRVSIPLLRTSWETLTFAHWPVEPARIEALLPHGLTPDVYDGAAWVSLTPFVMANMRPLGVPDLPNDLRIVPRLGPRVGDVSSTPETNLRTYVRGPDGRDGLWFFSLDIGSAALAAVIRGAVGAPYHKARLTVGCEDDDLLYTGVRHGGHATYRLRVSPGEPITPTDLEVWLTSRWRAYTTHLGRLLVTPVEHEPWPLRTARVESLDQSVAASAGLADLGEPAMVHFSEGVHHVRLGRPSLVRRSG